MPPVARERAENEKSLIRHREFTETADRFDNLDAVNTRLRLAALAPVVLVSALALSGCGFSLGGSSAAPVRDESGAISESSDNTDVFSLRVGDCLLDDSSAAEEVMEAPTVPCSEPHDYEAYHSVMLTGDAYPGDDVVAADADQACYDAFEPFAAFVYEDSVLDYTFYRPTEGSWEAGDREVLCLIGDMQGQVTGTLAGAAR